MTLAPRHGFTLLELATVIGIISLIMGFALSLGGNAIKSSERVATQERMKTIQSALESYIKANGYLPCPADRATTPAATAGFGFEMRAATDCTPGTGLVKVTVGAKSAYIGGVPVRTLGLPDAYAADAWHDKFTYAVSEPQIKGPGSYAESDPAKNATINIYYGDHTGTTGHFLLSDASKPGYGATYVLVSHGPDKRGAFPLNATTRAVPCGATGAFAQTDIENCDENNATPNLDFYDSDYNDRGATLSQHFDDYVLWGSNTLSRPATVETLACSGACEAWCAPCLPNAMLLNSNLPMDPANITNPVLCQKVITSTSPCRAACIWSGTLSFVPPEYARCP